MKQFRLVHLWLLALLILSACNNGGSAGGAPSSNLEAQSAAVTETLGNIEKHKEDTFAQLDAHIEIAKLRALTSSEADSLTQYFEQVDWIQFVSDDFFRSKNSLFITNENYSKNETIAGPTIFTSSKIWYYMPKSPMGHYAWGADDWFKIRAFEDSLSVDFTAANVPNPAGEHGWPYQYEKDKYPLDSAIRSFQPSANVTYKLKAQKVTRLELTSSQDAKATTYPWAFELSYLTVTDTNVTEAMKTLSTMFVSSADVLNTSPAVNTLVLIQLKQNLERDYEKVMTKIRAYKNL